jgi:hypothetical protein
MVTDVEASGREASFALLRSAQRPLPRIMESLYLLHAQGQADIATRIVSKISEPELFTERYLPLRRAIDSFNRTNRPYTFDDLIAATGMSKSQFRDFLPIVSLRVRDLGVKQLKVGRKPKESEKSREAVAETNGIEKTQRDYSSSIRGIAAQVSAEKILAMPLDELSRLMSRYLFSNNLETSHDSSTIQLFLSRRANRDFVKKVLEEKS